MASVLEKALRVGEGRLMRRLERITRSVNALEDDYRAFTDEELAGETAAFRARYAAGETLDDLLPEAFAAVRESAARTIGLRPFDVQVMGGAALHLGNIAEMRTGEGKTLVATLPAYLNAIAGEGVHVVTVNDFLAGYQAELMGRVFRALGMTTGVVVANQSLQTRKDQYAADITYGTNNEFGFDYLRDNMAASPDGLVQRGHFFAIVDEVDSILIDEARTPLIVAGPAGGDADRWFDVFAQLVRGWREGVEYEVNLAKRTVGVLGEGIDMVEDQLGIENLYAAENTPLISFLNNAIKAKALFQRDKDYVVLEGEVMIVDEHTGRMMAGRRYSEGVHQAIEAKEHVAVQPENQTYATVTLQNYFRLYKKLAGMTGTAETEAAEFMATYKLGVVPIPTHRTVKRIDQADLIYKNEIIKFEQVVSDIKRRHMTGQPVLVGTVSVEKSEYLSRLLAAAGVPHEVLNAKNHAREAAIVAQAGRLGAVTVATNMAGRGTDIMLGGNTEFLAVARLHEQGLTAIETPEAYEAAWPETLAAVKAEVAAAAEQVTAAGGLYVLGTERHESRRIDNQLRGRSGRQGDPGESRFYLSLNDELMRLFNAGAASALMGRGGMPDDVALESKLVSRAIRSAQGQMEARNAESRKDVLKYDDVMNRQRLAIYTDRHRILHGDDIRDWVHKFLETSIENLVDEHMDAQGGVNLDTLWPAAAMMYPVGITADEVAAEAGNRKVTRNMVVQELLSDAQLAYERHEAAVGPDAMRELERQVVLGAIDENWRFHLYEMDYLKEGIGLRAMAQRDPLIEYQKEGYDLFQSMMVAIRESVVPLLFKVETPSAMTLDVQPFDMANLNLSGPSEDEIGVQR